MKKVLIIAGTRPEIIKLAPVAHALNGKAEVNLVFTGQHREMGAAAWQWFDLRPRYNLDVMEAGQPLSVLLGRLLQTLEPVLAAEQPDVVVVQGDTASALAGALAAFYRRIPVAHVEAGLRTFDMTQPFPEEMQRVLISRLAALHFAPTAQAREYLLKEGVPGRQIFVTGNTVVDSLQWLLRSGKGQLPEDLQRAADMGWNLITVTAHRRENMGEPLETLCEALVRMAARGDVEIAFPVHPNPEIRGMVYDRLSNVPGIMLVDPLPYPDFIRLLQHSRFIITDSGGIQEEASVLRKPVVLLRNVTERPEAEAAGVVKRVSPRDIFEEASRLLYDKEYLLARSQSDNLYGEGDAAQRMLLMLNGNYLAGIN